MEIPEGIKTVEIFDLKGRQAFEFDNAADVKLLKLPSTFRQGLYQVILPK